MNRNNVIAGYIADAALMANKDIPERVVEIYLEDLQPHSLDEIKYAFDTHRKTSKFFPMVSELLVHMDDNNEESAEVAWNDVIEHLYGRIQISGPTLQALERIGGYRRLSQEDSRYLDHKYKKSFISAYDANVRLATSGIEYHGRVNENLLEL